MAFKTRGHKTLHFIRKNNLGIRSDLPVDVNIQKLLLNVANRVSEKFWYIFIEYIAAKAGRCILTNSKLVSITN